MPLTSRGSKTGRDEGASGEMVEHVPGGPRRNIQPAPRLIGSSERAATCSIFRSKYRTLATTTSRLLLHRAAGRCRIALLFSRSRGVRALSACVFRGRGRAAGGCSCRTIFHCTTAARGRTPVLGIASCCLAQRDHQQRSLRLRCFRPLVQRREYWKVRTLWLGRLS